MPHRNDSRCSSHRRRSDCDYYYRDDDCNYYYRNDDCHNHHRKRCCGPTGPTGPTGTQIDCLTIDYYGTCAKNICEKVGSSPPVGCLCLDTTDGILHRYNGTTWEIVRPQPSNYYFFCCKGLCDDNYRCACNLGCSCGTIWYVKKCNDVTQVTGNDGDLLLLKSDVDGDQCDLFVYKNDQWCLKCSLRGPTGPNGPRLSSFIPVYPNDGPIHESLEELDCNLLQVGDIATIEPDCIKYRVQDELTPCDSEIEVATTCGVKFCRYIDECACKKICCNPGNDGDQDISGIVNRYYPGVGNANCDEVNVRVNAANSVGAPAVISVDDLILIHQTQDATINDSNTSEYGDGTVDDPARGVVDIDHSGKYEFGCVVSVTEEGEELLVEIKTPLKNNYVSGTNQHWQVVRVPQYANATLVWPVTSSEWDGAKGGIVSFNVENNLDLNGNSVEVTGQGFRGNQYVLSGGNSDSLDYRAAAVNSGGSKGEGIVGTPANGLGGDGYPPPINDFARGAPGNAGGGGNALIAGGGGGGNGGQGGNGATGADGPPGFGGDATPVGFDRLYLGGGGGQGHTSVGVNTEAGDGGGIILIITNTVSGSGVLSANGSGGDPGPGGGHGGGAGGSVMLSTSNLDPGVVVGVFARGGAGTTGTLGGGGGGGGGGGYLYSTLELECDTAGGVGGGLTPDPVQHGLPGMCVYGNLELPCGCSRTISNP